MTVLIILAAYFALLMLIARLTGRGSGSDAAFFRGENRSPWYVVSFGMIGASISGVTFVSVPGMVRSLDMTYMQTVFGFFFGYMAVAHILLPLYYRLNLTSIYGYLGGRLGRHSYRTGSFFFLLSRMLGTAAKLYLVCRILHVYVFSSLGIPFAAVTIAAVAAIWLYTRRSGMKTIIWTDTLQTFCLIAAVAVILIVIAGRLDMGFSDALKAVAESPHSRIFVFDDWASTQNFFKQFLSGIFIVIVMTGLDQDMMQKNLSCRSLKEAQKNMYFYGFSFIPLNFILMSLGILLLLLAESSGTALPAVNDDILPMFAMNGTLGGAVFVFFAIGMIAATFSNADSALTAMTTSVCVDLAGTGRMPESKARKTRNTVHVLLAILLAGFVLLVDALGSQSVINAIYIIASYTYGPLLGMFAFGLFTRRQPRDRITPLVAVASPLLCFALDRLATSCWGYHFGYELLMLNGLLTFLALLAFSRRPATTL